MFNFVKQDSLSDYTPVTKEDISRIENKFSVVFPDILKEYYLKYNLGKMSTASKAVGSI